MDCGAKLFGCSEPLRVGVDVVDTVAERRSQARGVKADRLTSGDEHTPIGFVECGQFGSVRSDSPPGIDDVVRQRRDADEVDAMRDRHQHRVGIRHEHQVRHEPAAVDAGEWSHAVHGHERQRRT